MKVKKLYHLHTIACNHATLTLDEMVEYSLKNGYEKLIFTEHYPYPNSDETDEWTSQKTFDGFYQNFVECKKKYGNKIEMHFGCETEFPRAGREFFLNIKNDNRVEFAIFGNHKYLDMFMKDDKNETVDSLNKKYNEIKDIGTHTKKDLKNYYILSKDALKSGMFSYFAHPDLWINRYKKWDRYAKKLSKKLIRLAIKYNCTLGFNSNGLAKKIKKNLVLAYPLKYFWEMVAKHKEIKVIIESDAHKLEHISTEWLDNAYDIAISYGLKDNLVEDVTLKPLQ